MLKLIFTFNLSNLKIKKNINTKKKMKRNKKYIEQNERNLINIF